MTTTASRSLAEAWQQRYTAILDELIHAENAPALFKPEHVERLTAEGKRAVEQMAFWSGEARR